MSAATQSKIERLLEQLLDGLYEREEVMKLSLLAALAGESIFILGPPGVGKSLIARRLKHAFRDGNSFEYLMTRFSTPDEVFGPISIKKLKEEDKYERLTENYMPGANLVFLDEIWKSSSSIQNALLTILNERVYRNGEQEVEVDIKGMVTASNELPPNEESFGPLYDRLLVRYQLDGIRDNRNFVRMITGTEDVYTNSVEEENQITAAELETWQAEIDAVQVPDEVLSTIQLVRQKIEEANEAKMASMPIFTYDRRWKKIVRLLRTSAYLNDREQVDLMDCFLMVHCLWNQPEHIPVIQELVAETIRKHGYSLSIGLNHVKKELADFEQEVDQEIRIRHTTTEEVLKPIDERYYHLLKNGEAFTGEFIQVKDYNKLAMGSAEVTNLYDTDFKLVNRLSAEKSGAAHELRVHHNSQVHTLGLETYKKEKVNTLYKKPHPLVKRMWDERHDKLRNYLAEQQERLQTEQPAELGGIASNLFIDHRLADLVRANLNELTETLEQLQLRLEKVQYSYEHID